MQQYPHSTDAAKAAFSLGNAMRLASDRLTPDQYDKAQERAIRFAERTRDCTDNDGQLTVLGLQVVARQLRREVTAVSKRSHR
jgi:hypothetical protein